MVQADGGYGEIIAFRVGLHERELEYVVQVKGVTSGAPGRRGAGHPCLPGPRPSAEGRYPDQPSSLRALVLAAGVNAARPVAWREGDRGP